MKKLSLLFLAGSVLLFLTACNKEESQVPTSSAPEPTQPSSMTDSPAAPSNPSGTSGTVVETMNAAGYTYVNVDSGTEKIWAAAPEFAVNVGDQVVVPEGMAMHNYHSNTLDRDFSVVYFVESVLNASDPTMPGTVSAASTPQMPKGHPDISTTSPSADIDFSNIEKITDGKTIAEIYQNQQELSEQNIKLRGKVVKFSPQIMGTNWIHVQDGTGDQTNGTNDLTITSNSEVQVGDTIVVDGQLTLGKDFGYGYKYDLIMENASVTVE